MWYCVEVGGMGLDTEALLCRAEVYEKCMESEMDSSSARAMDLALPFIPKSCYYRVVKMYKGA